MSGTRLPRDTSYQIRKKKRVAAPGTEPGVQAARAIARLTLERVSIKKVHCHCLPGQGFDFGKALRSGGEKDGFCAARGRGNVEADQSLTVKGLGSQRKSKYSDGG